MLGFKLNHVSKRGQWASYQIRKIAGCACAGNAGNVFPRRLFQRKPLVSDPGMHHGTCVTHVPWCMSGSLTCGDGENVPGIPGACAPANLRIWQEAHGVCWLAESSLFDFWPRWPNLKMRTFSTIIWGILQMCRYYVASQSKEIKFEKKLFIEISHIYFVKVCKLNVFPSVSNKPSSVYSELLLKSPPQRKCSLCYANVHTITQMATTATKKR